MKGICLSQPEVIALQAGRLKQLWRPMRPQPVFSEPGGEWGWQCDTEHEWGCWIETEDGTKNTVTNGPMLCRYTVGDQTYFIDHERAYVKETWAPAYRSVSYEYGDACYFQWNALDHGWPDHGRWILDENNTTSSGLTLHYLAQGEDVLPAEFTMPGGTEIPWRPAITMPSWASRFTIEILNVAARQVSSITEEEARESGPTEVESGGPPWNVGWTAGVSMADYELNDITSGKKAFARLWDRKYGRGSFDGGAWAWVLYVRRVER